MSVKEKNDKFTKEKPVKMLYSHCTRKKNILVKNRLMDGLFSLKKPSPGVWDELLLFEKIQYYAQHLTSDYAPFVDKLEAKKNAKRLCPEICIPHVYKIFDKHQNIKPSDIVLNSFFKASHGCGWNMYVKPNISAALLNKKRKKWSRQYSTTEKQYTFLTPRFFFEKKIDCYFGNSSSTVVDIKVMCIYGEPVFILVKRWAKKFYLDITWSVLLHVHDTKNLGGKKIVSLPPRPPDLQKILTYARQLSAPFECVRIDLYIGKDKRIYFSEFTFTPAAGKRRFTIDVEKEIAKTWTYTRPQLN